MSERLSQASALAEALHRGQARKGTTIPYISHLYAVAALLMEWGADEDVVIAGLLHDAVEDCGGSTVADEIQLRFGGRVADAVLACSDSLEEAAGAKAAWLDRKRAHIAAAARFSADAALVTAADKIHNLRALTRDLALEGASTLARFRQPDRLVWYYSGMANAVSAALPANAAAELRSALTGLKEQIGLAQLATSRGMSE